MPSLTKSPAMPAAVASAQDLAGQLTAVNRTALEALAAKASVSSALDGPAAAQWMQTVMGAFGRSDAASRASTPLVQRASFYRTSVVEAALRHWLADPSAGPSEVGRQVVVVGAGLDPGPLRLLGDSPDQAKLVFFELDAAVVLQGKRTALMASPEARALLFGGADSGPAAGCDQGSGDAWCWRSPRLRMASVDLAGRDCLAAPLQLCGFDPAVPTLVLVECVLSYLPPEGAAGLLAEAAALSDGPVSLIMFEPLRGRGALGAALSQHFKARSCPLMAHQSVGVAPSATALQDLEASVRAAGWDTKVDACNMNDAADRWVTVAERSRAARLLGPFDEHAALFSLQQHYGLIIASASGNSAKTRRSTSEVKSSTALPLSARASDDVGSAGGDLAIRVLVVGSDEQTVAACRALVVSSHGSLAKDYPAVKRFWKHALKKDLADPVGFYNDDAGGVRRRFWVATRGGVVVGCVAVCEATRPLGTSSVGLELRRLAVAPSERRRGVGEALVKAVVEFAAFLAASEDNNRRDGKPSAAITVCLTCLDGRAVPAATAACGLYEKLGFVRTQLRESSGGGADAVPMCDMEMVIRGSFSLTPVPGLSAESPVCASVHHRSILESLAEVRREAHASLAAAAADGSGGAVTGPDWLLPSCFELYASEIQPKAARVRSRSGALSFSLDRAWKLVSRVPAVLLLEFGVYKGGDIAFLAKIAAAKSEGAVFHGFDSFEGLPEHWDTGLKTLDGVSPAYPAGAFDLKGCVPGPDVVGRNVHLYKGWFTDTVPRFFDEHQAAHATRRKGPPPAAFVHADADLYSSTITFLRELCARKLVVKGTVFNFDEFWNYPGWEDGEFKAWTETVKEFGLEFEYICFHGPETESSNLKSANPEKWANLSRSTKAEPERKLEPGSNFKKNEQGHMSVTVIVTGVR